MSKQEIELYRLRSCHFSRYFNGKLICGNNHICACDVCPHYIYEPGTDAAEFETKTPERGEDEG